MRLTPSAFAVRFVQESNAIEGIHAPVEWLTRPWSEQGGHMQAYREAVAFAGRDEPLQALDLHNWQSLIVREQPKFGDRLLRDDQIGVWRTVGVRIRSADGRTKPIGSVVEDVVADMRQLIRDVNAGLAAPYVHHRFERVHPYIDGNGRTGRLLALFCAIRHGQPAVLFTDADKALEYYPAFEQASFHPMREYFARHAVTEKVEWL